MKIVGLHIEKDRVSAAILEKGFRNAELKENLSASYESEEALHRTLKEWSRSWTGAKIIASIPGSRFTQRLVGFPFTDRGRVEKALPFEVEDTIPFPIEDVVMDHVLLAEPGKKGEEKQETPVLAMMIQKPVLRQQLDILAAAGIDPQAIAPSYLGLLAVSRTIPAEGTVLFLSGSDLCLKSNGVVLECRALPSNAGGSGMGHTLKSLETSHNVTIDRIVSLDREYPAEGGDQETAIELIVPEYGGKRCSEPISLGLALSGEVNFRKGEFAYRLIDEGARKRRYAVIIAAVVALLLGGANFGTNYYMTRSSYLKLDREIKGMYHELFPQEKTVGDPVRQLRAKLEEARKQFGVLGSGGSALDLMRAVTDGIPKEVRVTFNEFNLEGDRLKLQGEAQSFESIDKIKDALSRAGVFSDVMVQDTRMGVDNKVKFRVELKVSQTGESMRQGGSGESGTKR